MGHYLDFIWIQRSAILFVLHAMFNAFDDISDEVSIIYTEKLGQLCCRAAPGLEVRDFPGE